MEEEGGGRREEEESQFRAVYIKESRFLSHSTHTAEEKGGEGGKGEKGGLSHPFIRFSF